MHEPSAAVVWQPAERERRRGTNNRPGASRTHEEDSPCPTSSPKADRQLGTPGFGVDTPDRRERGSNVTVRPPLNFDSPAARPSRNDDLAEPSTPPAQDPANHDLHAQSSPLQSSASQSEPSNVTVVCKNPSEPRLLQHSGGGASGTGGSGTPPSTRNWASRDREQVPEAIGAKASKPRERDLQDSSKSVGSRSSAGAAVARLNSSEGRGHSKGQPIARSHSSRGSEGTQTSKAKDGHAVIPPRHSHSVQALQQELLKARQEIDELRSTRGQDIDEHRREMDELRSREMDELRSQVSEQARMMQLMQKQMDALLRDRSRSPSANRSKQLAKEQVVMEQVVAKEQSLQPPQTPATCQMMSPGRKREQLSSPVVQHREMPANIAPAHVAAAYVRTTAPFPRDAEGSRRRREVPACEASKPPGSPLIQVRHIDTPSSPDRWSHSFEPAANHRHLHLQRDSLRSIGSTAVAAHSMAPGSSPCSTKLVPASPIVLPQARAAQMISRSGRSLSPSTASASTLKAQAQAKSTAGLASSLSHATLRPKAGPQGSPTSASAGIRNVTPPASYRVVGRPDYAAMTPRA